MRPLLLALALAGLLAWGGLPAPFDAIRSVSASPAPADDPAGYRDALRRALIDLESSREGEAGQVAARLRAIEQITLPDGTPVRPDVGAIVAALESRPPNLGEARTRLRAVMDELDASQSLARGAWALDPEDRLRRVLERPEFLNRPRVDPIGSFLRWIGELLGGWIDLLLSPLRWLVEQWLRAWVSGIGGGSWQSIAALAGLVLIFGLIAWVVRRVRRAMGPAPVAAPVERAGASMTAEELRAEAVDLARRGEFRAAARALYLAALLQWDERGVLRFDRTLTNREVLAKARREVDPTMARRLAPLVERFDRLWYGGASCSAEDYAELARLAAAACEAA